MPTLLLLVLGSLLFFTKITSPLLEPEEARYAEIPRQMSVEGNVVAPVLHGMPYYHKPPLLYWLVMASYQLFGVYDWAARLIPGAAGVLTVLVIYWWGRRFLGAHAAFLSALILCLSARFIYLQRMLTTDAVLSLCVIAALLAAYCGISGDSCRRRNRRRWWFASAVGCGIGLLTKGPVALALVVVPVFAFQLLDTRVPRPGFASWIAFVGVALGIAAPWYIALAVIDWNAFVTFFWFHNVVRYVAPFDHAKPFWFYLPSLFFGMLPWSLALIPFGISLLRTNTESTNRNPPALGFFLLAFVWCVLFFSCSGCKRPLYILPALPILAIVLGCYLSRATNWRQPAGTRFSWLKLPSQGAGLAWRMTVSLIVVGLGISLVAVHTAVWDESEGSLAAAILIAALAAVILFGRRLAASAAWLVCAAVLYGMLVGAVHQLLPDYNRRFALRGEVRRHRRLCASENLPVVCYPRRWDSVSFYLRHDDVRAYSSAQREQLLAELLENSASLVFIRDDPATMREFVAKLPPSLQFVPFARQRGKIRSALVVQRINSFASR